ncbi:DUF4153 domain-containing protein [Nocardioides coralli]|uniref:DUF4153 domain-containing protein n=1 Tax=Nocardioides coralli TaxID=2872154 RepID=UPI001CA42AAE|nr:DUF4153 domain-containing protein [Nocardioides coralli]QZY30553.1 DUF4173 domain-containing protein [Nocardioides coralli]
MTPASPGPLDAVSSIKVKLGALVAASVVVAAVVGAAGSRAGVPLLLALPVAVALALGVTQLLAAGMVAPLREMTVVAQRMARGDYAGRVRTQATDEVGRLAAAFNRMAADLATVDRERRELVATVSHEIRTPLAALTAVLENLADGVVAPDRPHLQDALEQAERLGALVSDLLELSRLDAGATRLDLGPVLLHELVAQSLQQVAASGRDVGYDVQVPEKLSVTGDALRLRQLLTNSLDNAARHGPAGSTVRITAGEESGRWWLEVADDGPGVAPADRERVFDRFGTVTDTHGGGTGLGLAIARWVATLHGGTLRFVDPPGGSDGARLRLELPAEPAPSPTEETLMTTTASPADPVPVAAPAAPLLDTLFGRFWPEPPGLRGPLAITGAAVVGVLGGALLTFRPPGLAWLLVLLAALVTAWSVARHRSSGFARLCSILAALLVLPVVLRAGDWMVPLCLAVAAAVFLVGVTSARGLPGMVIAWLAWPLASLRGLPWFGRRLRLVGTGGRTPAVVRTVAWSALGVSVFVVLFASADALFASWVDALLPSLTLGDVVVRGFVAVLVFGLTLAAAYVALNPPRTDLVSTAGARPLANRFEWLAPVLLVDAVFVAFLAAQATAVFGGHAYLERTTGLTYADYVHEGFGQLTVATALTLLVVWVAARRAGRSPADRRWLLASLGTLCCLTLVVVASALHRMHVYQEAYGFTRLRLLVDAFEGWLGLLVLAVMVAGTLRLGRWLPRFALVSGAATVLALAVLNPDAWIAERNIDRWEETGRLDVFYLSQLSGDATPVIAERLPRPLAACAVAGFGVPPGENVLDWNLGRERARAALASIGPDPTAPCPEVVGED